VNFGLTCLLQAKKAKADRIVVLCKSVAGTGHGRAKVGYPQCSRGETYLSVLRIRDFLVPLTDGFGSDSESGSWYFR
jgi:hypothetical protein